MRGALFEYHFQASQTGREMCALTESDIKCLVCPLCSVCNEHTT